MGNGCYQKGKYNSEFGLQHGIAASLAKNVQTQLLCAVLNKS